MIFQQLNRTDAEKVFIIVRNTSGGTLAANLPMFFEADAQTDGLAVSQMQAGGALLFAGINDASLADDGYGLCQVYGKRTSCVVSAVASVASLIPGTRLVGVAGAAYLGYGSSVSTADQDSFVYSLETKASADDKSATSNCIVFIRAL
jgi:hypothetical protein